MAQPKDLGEIRSLIQTAPDFKPGDYCHIAVYDGLTKTLAPGLFEVQKVGIVDITVHQIGGSRGLIVADHSISVPIWATLGRVRIQ